MSSKYVMGVVAATTNKSVKLYLKEYEDKKGRIVKNEEKSLLWLPFSQIDVNEEMCIVGAELEVDVPDWLMDKKGLV